MPPGTEEGLTPGNFMLGEMGLDPGHIVLDGYPAPLRKKGHNLPMFGLFLLWSNGWMHQDGTWYGGRHQPGYFVLDGDRHLPKKVAEPQVFGPCL